MASLASYPFSLETDFAPERSRLTTFFRGLLVIPHAIVMIVYGIGLLASLVISWFAVMLTGRYPEALYRFNRGVLGLSLQISGYWMLATDRYPPFGLDATSYPVRLAGQPDPPPSSNRLLVLFRYFTAIPWAILNSVYVFVALIGVIASWFVIVFTGRQPEGLQKMIQMGLASTGHYYSYFSFLTDTWPPIEPDVRLEPRLGGGDGGPGGGSLPPAGGFAEPAAPQVPAGDASKAFGEPRPDDPEAPGMTSGDPLSR